jgi:formamidopyrimidine-DNA glycosylase
MPELPDVCGFERYLQSTALGQRVTRSRLTAERLLLGVTRQRLQSRLNGARLQRTLRRGKWLLVALEDGERSRGWLGLHFGMTGELRYLEATRPQPDELPDHTRLLLSFENGYHLAYRSQRLLGYVTHANDPAAFFEQQALGPDALESGLDAAGFAQRLRGRRAQIKTALMDQSLLAGIGNVYADEILFQTELHPATPIPELKAKQLRHLHRVSQRVLRLACRRGGAARELPRTYLLPHREEGARCPRCGGRIDKLRVAGRPTYVCETHQGREA